jgi:glycosyltransferase involved in cell wall biosynthesis
MTVKVCFISPGSYALFNQEKSYTFGGAEVQIYLNAARLAKLPGLQVSCIVGDFGQPDEETREKVRLIKGMRYEKRSILNFLSPANKIAQWKAMRAADADVYVVRTASALVGLTRLFSSMIGKKLVYMAANDIDCNGLFERTSNLFVGRLYASGLKRADLVIAQSIQQQDMLRIHHKKESIVIRSGYAIEAKSRRRKTSVLWVGRCEESKDPVAFLELARGFSDQRFVMICPKGEDEDLYRKVQGGIPSNVEYISSVPFSRIGEYFAEAKVFVNTSKHEGFPNTFIQSFLEGTPLLSLAVDPDGLFSNGVGYCAGGNPDLLRRHLAKLLSDRKAWAQASKACRSYVKKHHDIETTARQLAEALKRLAE